MIFLRKISGPSMLPTLADGDYIIALKLPAFAYKKDDIVIAKHPEFGEIVKRIASIQSTGTFTLYGDGKLSVSSQRMGQLPLSQIRGRLLWHIAQK